MGNRSDNPPFAAPLLLPVLVLRFGAGGVVAAEERAAAEAAEDSDADAAEEGPEVGGAEAEAEAEADAAVSPPNTEELMLVYA